MSQQVFIVAGEASADTHGAKLVRELKAARPDAQVFGVGGKAMREAGADCIVEASEMAVAGLTEVLWALPRLLGIARKLLRAVDERKPAVAVLIDHPDFNLRLAKKLKARGVRVVYYISPQVWAWRQKRVEVIRQRVDQMLVILPFEQAFYEKHGVAAQFVGHPFIEELPEKPSAPAARAALGLPAQGPLVALLPGSRRKEVVRHLPVMLEGLRLLRERLPETRALLPVASTIPRQLITDAVQRAGVEVEILEGNATQALSAADAAVVCSGTATLQAALLERPIVVVYRVSWLTYQILKRMIKVAHIAMVNLIAGRALVPELIQHAFTAANVARELERLLTDREARAQLTSELSAIRQKLGQGGTSIRVARVVAGYLPSGSP
jgi:lipid-A-disaccharide synthase